MQKIENFDEVLDYLKNKEVVTLDNGNYFIMKDKKIISYHKGNRIIMDADTFKELYFKNTFYEYEDNIVFIDPIKDQEYYSFKHK